VKNNETLDFDSIVSYYAVMENADEPLFTIAEVAEKANVSRRTVRYYVQRGLIDAPVGRGRGSGYTQKHVEQIQRVLRLQREGLGLGAIEQLPPGTEPAGQASGAPPALFLRLPLMKGVSLEVEGGNTLPAPDVLDRLAAACREILQNQTQPMQPTQQEPLDEAAADAAEGGEQI
jgi:DNA-binding transcriptional MerR regulator